MLYKSDIPLPSFLFGVLEKKKKIDRTEFVDRQRKQPNLTYIYSLVWLKNRPIEELNQKFVSKYFTTEQLESISEVVSESFFKTKTDVELLYFEFTFINSKKGCAAHFDRAGYIGVAHRFLVPLGSGLEFSISGRDYMLDANFVYSFSGLDKHKVFNHSSTDSFYILMDLLTPSVKSNLTEEEIGTVTKKDKLSIYDERRLSKFREIQLTDFNDSVHCVFPS